MTTYLIVRVFHLVGALGMFTALGVELAVLFSLSSARFTSAALHAIEVHRVNAVVGPMSFLLVLVPGLYMASAGWGWQAWLVLCLWARSSSSS